MSPSGLRLSLTILVLLVLVILCALFLNWIGIDALEGRNHWQFFADSETYHAAARGEVVGEEELGDLVSVASNFLGPVLLVWAVGDNYYVVMLVNVLFLFLAVRSIAKSLHLDLLLFTLLVLMNPLTISSVLSVNKEIISLLFVALFLRNYTRHSAAVFVCALLISVLARWQLTLFLLTFSVLTSRLNPLRQHRLATLSVLLLGMSVLYVALSSLFQGIKYNIEMSAGDYQGSGFFELLGSVQDHGGYFLIFPLKAAHQLFALGLRFDRLFAPKDIYNDFWQLLHSTMLLVIFIALCVKRRFRLRDDLIYMSILYMAVFGISPIYSPRYFYPVYVLWVAALAAGTSPVQFLSSWRARRVGSAGPGTAVPAVQ